MLKPCKSEAEKEHTTNLPENLGDKLLVVENTDPKIQALFGKARRDGATDHDIRTWWNLHDLERRIMLKSDEASQRGFVIDQLHKLKPTEETMTECLDKAAAAARKGFPLFGDPDDTTVIQGDDRALPPEPKFRVNAWVQRKVRDPKFKEERENSTTLNALIRHEIAAGKL